MGTRFQQAIPPHLLLQGNSDRFAQPISQFPFSQSEINLGQNAFRRQPSRLALLASNQFRSDDTNQNIGDNLNQVLPPLTKNPISSNEEKFIDRYNYVLH